MEKEPTIEELLDKLIREGTSDEDVKLIGQIKAATQKLDDDRLKALEDKQAYREKYVKAIQEGDFALTHEAPQSQTKGPISIEDLLSEYSQRKEGD